MKKKSVLWLLPLAAALFLIFPSTLSALTNKEQRDLDSLTAKEAKLKPGKSLSRSNQQKLDGLRAKKAQEEMAVSPSLGNEISANPIQSEPYSPTIVTGLTESPTTQEVTEPVVTDADRFGTNTRPVTTTSSPAAANLQAPLGNAEWADKAGNIPTWIIDPNELRAKSAKIARDQWLNEKSAWEQENEGTLYPIPEPVEGDDLTLYGVGSAKNSTDRLSIQMADARARQDIALQRDVQVRALITDWAENEGSKNSEFNNSSASAAQLLGRQFTEIKLQDIKVEKRARASDGTWWVVVSYQDPEVVAVRKAADRARAEKVEKAKAARAAAVAAANANAADPDNAFLDVADDDPVPGKYDARILKTADLLDKELEKAKLADEQLKKANLKPTSEAAPKPTEVSE
jgi:hypothetical protein